MKYRIDAVVGPTTKSATSFSSNPETDTTTTVGVGFEGIEEATATAKRVWGDLTEAFGEDARGVHVINETMSIVLTLDAANPNG